jgi:anti-sigma regulatory factor (Ser/Thr protein kinase)
MGSKTIIAEEEMIKLKDLLKETIACGECLSYAYTYAVKSLGKKNVKITYGTVQNKWISNNKRYNHAWAEDRGKVKDWQTMKAGSSKYAGKGWPIKEFYKFWNVKNEKKYEPLEVIQNYTKHKSIIGWDWK